MAKSRLTKAKEISPETKQKVWDRQHGRSISGVALSPYNVEFHHDIGNIKKKKDREKFSVFFVTLFYEQRFFGCPTHQAA